MSIDRRQKPAWRPGYRFQYEPAQKGHVLLYPEGMIKLNDSAALIGGLIGAGAGTGGAAFTGNRDVELPAETALRFRLVKPLEIRP